MTTAPLQVERRVGQRFPYLLPLSLCQRASSADVRREDVRREEPVRRQDMERVGFTQNLSSRGVFFYTDAPLTEGADIELTLRMPSEITLGESMPVRCRGRILRVVRPAARLSSDSSGSVRAETKIGVAVRFEGYEYLSEVSATSAAFARISTLHHHDSEEQPLAHSSARPVLG